MFFSSAWRVWAYLGKPELGPASACLIHTACTWSGVTPACLSRWSDVVQYRVPDPLSSGSWVALAVIPPWAPLTNTSAEFLSAAPRSSRAKPSDACDVLLIPTD